MLNNEWLLMRAANCVPWLPFGDHHDVRFTRAMQAVLFVHFKVVGVAPSGRTLLNPDRFDAFSNGRAPCTASTRQTLDFVV